MAKKARKKSAAKTKKKTQPAPKTKTKALPKKKKAARKAKPIPKPMPKPKTIGDRLSSAYHAVVDTVTGTDQLRNKMEKPGTSVSE